MFCFDVKTLEKVEYTNDVIIAKNARSFLQNDGCMFYVDTFN